MSEERVAVLGGAQAGSEHLAVERRAVDAADAPRGVLLARVGDVRASREVFGATRARAARRGDVRGLGEARLELGDLAVPGEEIVASQGLLAAVGRGEAHHVHEVALHDAHVDQVLAIVRGLLRRRERRGRGRGRGRRAGPARAGTLPLGGRLPLQLLRRRRVESDRALVVRRATRGTLRLTVLRRRPLHQLMPAPRAYLVPARARPEVPVRRVQRVAAQRAVRLLLRCVGRHPRRRPRLLHGRAPRPSLVPPRVRRLRDANHVKGRRRGPRAPRTAVAARARRGHASATNQKSAGPAPRSQRRGTRLVLLARSARQWIFSRRKETSREVALETIAPPTERNEARRVF